MEKKEYSLELGGRTISAIFSDLTPQTNGSVMVKVGETVILATAVMSKNRRDDIDYFPLTVEFEEKFYAAGKILGSRFIKREGRPSEEAILSGRIIDRTIRPLFPQQLRNEVQVITTVLSIDEENDPDVYAVIAASLALGVSDIPWSGPVSAVRYSQHQSGELILNPSYTERETGQFDLLVCGRDNKIVMIESEADQVSETDITQTLNQAVEQLEKIQHWQQQIITDLGQKKQMITRENLSAELLDLFQQQIETLLPEIIFGSAGGAKRAYDLRDKWLELALEQFPGTNKNLLLEHFEQAVNGLLHDYGLEKGQRADGRKFDQIRPLYTQAGGISSVVHGSGLFYRGETHVLSFLTLGGPKDSQLVEGMELQEKKYFMHHYNFPPFSVGETGRLGGVNRRSVGHGALAEKSLKRIIPDRETFPYTIRLVSEVVSSNGSSSMGSVCASTLALMDGGVPIKAPVAGIAMGLLIDERGEKYKILTDIQGPEDHYGDMDFKVAGTEQGITGLQLDIKTDGIPVNILSEALTQAKVARQEILTKIKTTIAQPRAELSPTAPRIASLIIPQDKIGAIIGPGGKHIQKLCADTNTEIEIEDDGTVTIAGKPEGVNQAKQEIEEITHVYRAGEKFTGEVTRLMDFGAFVRIGREAEGLVHVSELAPWRVNQVSDIVKIGDRVPVVVKEIDEKGRINLSIKGADPHFADDKKPTPKPEIK